FFFFFQAEDGIRDLTVTGVQTCALPIFSAHRVKRIRQTIAEAYDKLRKVVKDLDPIKHPGFVFEPSNPSRQIILTLATTRAAIRSEERRVGKECRCRWVEGRYKRKSNSK